MISFCLSLLGTQKDVFWQIASTWRSTLDKVALDPQPRVTRVFEHGRSRADRPRFFSKEPIQEWIKVEKGWMEVMTDGLFFLIFIDALDKDQMVLGGLGSKKSGSQN